MEPKKIYNQICLQPIFNTFMDLWALKNTFFIYFISYLFAKQFNFVR